MRCSVAGASQKSSGGKNSSSYPSTGNEAQQIAKSIHRWITTQSRMWSDGAAVYEATFIAIQSARGRKSIEKKREHSQTAKNILEAIK